MKEKWPFLLLALALLMILLITPGCKKQSKLPPLDWANRPASCAHEPEPVGRWAKASINVYIDYSQIYAWPDQSAPGYAYQMVRDAYPPIIETWRDYCGKLGVPFELVDTADAADVRICFYWGPWTERQIKNALIEVVSEKHALAMASNPAISLPPRDSNYNGVCYYHTEGGAFSGVQCWLNVFAAEAYHGDPQSFSGYAESVFHHESGHWRFGLDDDRNSTIPGMMHYRMMTAWPMLHEQELVPWIYRAYNRTPKASKGLDCSG